jgi:hypothetical protein
VSGGTPMQVTGTRLTAAQGKCPGCRRQGRSISLIGYPNGTYGYAMLWNTAAVGPPWFGTLTVSTNGPNSSDNVYDIPPNSGRPG